MQLMKNRESLLKRVEDKRPEVIQIEKEPEQQH